MSVKNILLFVLIGFSGLLNAELPANISPSSIESPCNLPAPTNFQVVNIGTTWVDLTWIPSVPGSWHRIRTYETSSGNLVSNILVPPGLLVQRVNGLQPNTSYNSKINAVCEDGSDSDVLKDVDFQTIIVELIIIGKEPTPSTIDCSINFPGGSCPFPANGTLAGFMVRSINNPSINRKFYLSKTTELNVEKLSTKLKDSNTGQLLTIQCDFQDPDATGNYFQVFYQGVQIMDFDLYWQPGQGQGIISGLFYENGWQLVKFVTPPQPNGGLGGGGAFNGGSIGTLEESTTVVANAMPNPFSYQLNVQLTQFSEAPVQLSLFNLNGQRVLDQSFTGGSETYTLNTAHIPAGFYLLRVDHNGEVQTVKVVKTQ